MYYKFSLGSINVEYGLCFTFPITYWMMKCLTFCEYQTLYFLLLTNIFYYTKHSAKPGINGYPKTFLKELESDLYKSL